jgi:chromosome segregation ATPase
MTDGGRMATRDSNASAPRVAESLTAGEVPVTRAMLGSVRTEVLQRIDQAREEAKADTQKLDAKIDTVKAELKADIHEVKAELKADIHEVKADIHQVKAAMHTMQAQMARIELLVEEQNARNKVVLDGITTLLGRQDQVEQRLCQVNDTVRKLASSQRSG